MGHTPRAQFAVGRLPGIDVHKRRRVVVNGDVKFQGKVARLALLSFAVDAVRQHGAVDAKRLEPLHFVGLGGEPAEGWPLDDVIEREDAAHQHVRGRVLAATVAHVRDT